MQAAVAGLAPGSPPAVQIGACRALARVRRGCGGGAFAGAWCSGRAAGCWRPFVGLQLSAVLLPCLPIIATPGCSHAPHHHHHHHTHKHPRHPAPFCVPQLCQTCKREELAAVAQPMFAGLCRMLASSSGGLGRWAGSTAGWQHGGLAAQVPAQALHSTHACVHIGRPPSPCMHRPAAFSPHPPPLPSPGAPASCPETARTLRAHHTTTTISPRPQTRSCTWCWRR